MKTVFALSGKRNWRVKHASRGETFNLFPRVKEHFDCSRYLFVTIKIRRCGENFANK